MSRRCRRRYQYTHAHQDATPQVQTKPKNSHYSRPFPTSKHSQTQTEQQRELPQPVQAAQYNALTLPIMPKLTIGAVGDQYEQEADAMATQVVQQLNNPIPVQREEYEDEKSEMLPAQFLTQSLQRIEGDESEEERIQRLPLVQLKGASVGGAVLPELEQSIQRERGKGQPLAESIRQPMENAFGTNFGEVHIHTDNTADQLNQSIQAKAFTTGQDVFFRQGAYAPESKGGQELLAHELTHVVQQSRVAHNTPVVSAASDVSLAACPMVQMKRDLKEKQTEDDFKANQETYSRGDNFKNTDTVETAEQNYNKSLSSGQRLVQKALKWYKNANDKEAPIATDTGTYRSVAAAGYKVFWFFEDEDSVTICMVRGEQYADLDTDEVSGYDFDPRFEDDQSYMYSNTFNVKTGEFHASINYRSKDMEVAKQDGLPPALNNSEIIWFQQDFAKTVYREKFKDQGELSQIKFISRNEIGNTQTLDTIFMCDDQRKAFEGGSVTLDEPTEEAIALLGSPNGNSAVWILIQHMESGTVDIESVEYEADRLIIRYLS
ncbi:MAG: DUF4157 domain-containing protein [Spirulina sp. SIO3F2]|nr:DUF4157 domain-containing protein [Spirulina sp. SIO3F2]